MVLSHFPALELITHKHQSWAWFSWLLEGVPVHPAHSKHRPSLWLHQNSQCAITPYKCFLKTHFPLVPKLLFDIAPLKAWFSVVFDLWIAFQVQDVSTLHCLTWLLFSPRKASLRVEAAQPSPFLTFMSPLGKMTSDSPEDNSRLIFSLCTQRNAGRRHWTTTYYTVLDFTINIS